MQKFYRTSQNDEIWSWKAFVKVAQKSLLDRVLHRKKFKFPANIFWCVFWGLFEGLEKSFLKNWAFIKFKENFTAFFNQKFEIFRAFKYFNVFFSKRKMLKIFFANFLICPILSKYLIHNSIKNKSQVSPPLWPSK